MATANDIVTVEELKRQFRLPPEHTSDDGMFQDLIDRAIAMVATDTGLPLLDRAITEFGAFPYDAYGNANGELPIIVQSRDFKFDINNEDHDIDYWREGDKLAAAPNGSIARAEITRSIRSDDGKCLLLYSDTGWPADIMPGTNARIKGSVGIPADELPEPLKQAVVIMARFLFSGDAKWPTTSAYRKLIRPYKRVVRRGA